MKYIAYATGVIFILLSLVILFTDIFQIEQLPAQFKWTLGVVLFLYGVFRILVTFYKKRPKNGKE